MAAWAAAWRDDAVKFTVDTRGSVARFPNRKDAELQSTLVEPYYCYYYYYHTVHLSTIKVAQSLHREPTNIHIDHPIDFQNQIDG